VVATLASNMVIEAGAAPRRTTTRRRMAKESRGAVVSLPRKPMSAPSPSSGSSSQPGVPSGHRCHAT
jgi:hypothetical protein